jgi:hypothetical protein
VDITEDVGALKKDSTVEALERMRRDQATGKDSTASQQQAGHGTRKNAKPESETRNPQSEIPAGGPGQPGGIPVTSKPGDAVEVTFTNGLWKGEKAFFKPGEQAALVALFKKGAKPLLIGSGAAIDWDEAQAEAAKNGAIAANLYKRTKDGAGFYVMGVWKKAAK